MPKPHAIEALLRTVLPPEGLHRHSAATEAPDLGRRDAARRPHQAADPPVDAYPLPFLRNSELPHSQDLVAKAGESRSDVRGVPVAGDTLHQIPDARNPLQWLRVVFDLVGVKNLRRLGVTLPAPDEESDRGPPYIEFKVRQLLSVR